MNRTYELMFIVRPDMVEEELDKLISTLETAVSGSGGSGCGGRPPSQKRLSRGDPAASSEKVATKHEAPPGLPDDIAGP